MSVYLRKFWLSEPSIDRSIASTDQQLMYVQDNNVPGGGVPGLRPKHLRRVRDARGQRKYVGGKGGSTYRSHRLCLNRNHCQPLLQVKAQVAAGGRQWCTCEGGKPKPKPKPEAAAAPAPVPAAKGAQAGSRGGCSVQ